MFLRLRAAMGGNVNTLYALRTFVHFLFTRTVANWRKHRQACRALLPQSERASDVEEAKP